MHIFTKMKLLILRHTTINFYISHILYEYLNIKSKVRDCVSIIYFQLSTKIITNNKMFFLTLYLQKKNAINLQHLKSSFIHPCFNKIYIISSEFNFTQQFVGANAYWFVNSFLYILLQFRF